MPAKASHMIQQAKQKPELPNKLQHRVASFHVSFWTTKSNQKK
jgi:hypothetical protein